MELVNIRELYRNQEEYLDKTVTTAAGCEASEALRILGLLL